MEEINNQQEENPNSEAFRIIRIYEIKDVDPLREKSILKMFASKEFIKLELSYTSESELNLMAYCSKYYITDLYGLNKFFMAFNSADQILDDLNILFRKGEYKFISDSQQVFLIFNSSFNSINQIILPLQKINKERQKKLELEDLFALFRKTNEKINELYGKNIKLKNKITKLLEENEKLKKTIEDIKNNHRNYVNNIKNNVKDFFNEQITPMKEMINNLNDKIKKKEEEEDNLRQEKKILIDNSHMDLSNFSDNITNFGCQTTASKNVFGNAYSSIAAYQLGDSCAEIAYSTNSPQNNIEIYDLIEKKVKKVIQGAHTSNKYITRIKYYFDPNKGIHYLVSSSMDNSVKVWNINQDYLNELTLTGCHKGNYNDPVLMIFDSFKYFILTGNEDKGDMKIFDKGGKKIGKIDLGSNKNLNCEVFYINGGIFILSMGKPGITLYDYKRKKKIRNLVAFNDDKVCHFCAFISLFKDKWTIFDSDDKGRVSLWDFETGNLNFTIMPQFLDKSIEESPKDKDKVSIYSICLWNQKYLLAAGIEKTVKIYDFEQKKYIKEYPKHSNQIWEMRKIKVYDEEILITVGWEHIMLLWGKE